MSCSGPVPTVASAAEPPNPPLPQRPHTDWVERGQVGLTTMPAMRRKILAAVGATLSLFLVLAILGPLFFTGQNRDAVLDAAGGQLTADLAVGDVSLSLLRSFPSASVRLADVAITGRGGHDVHEDRERRVR